MPTTTTLGRRRNAVAILTGTLNLATGLAVLAGYALQDPRLVTLLPGAAPMRFTTALAILCSGAAVLLLAGGYLRTAAAISAVCGATGLAVLAEAISGVHLAGFDPAAFAGGTPPRAGLLIACLTILAAVALLLMSGVLRVRARLALVGLAGSVLLAAGLVAVISYLGGMRGGFTTGAFSQLAIHTGAALAALGAALIRFAWRDSMAAQMGVPAWTPLLVASGALATTFGLYGAMTADQEADFTQQVNFEAEGLRQFLQAGLDDRIQPLIRLARRRAAVPDLKKDEWDADAQAILTRGGYQAIEWIDPAGRPVWTAPPGAGDATPDGSAAFEPRRQAAFDTAKQTRELAATRTIDLVTGGKGMLVVVPVFARDELAGYIAGVFRYSPLFQNLLASNPVPSLAIAVSDGGEPVFSQGSFSQSRRVRRAMEITVGSFPWKLEIGPTEGLVVQAHSPAGGALLVAGVFLSILFSSLVYLVQRSGAQHAVERVIAAAPAPGMPGADALPVISYHHDGSPAAWNEAASLLFGGAPPPVSAGRSGFRTIQATLLRAGASPDGIEALRSLLDSCAQPALLFDAEGAFAAANPAAAQALGWSDAVWSGRSFGTAGGARESLEVRNVLLMQGQWAVPAPGAAAAQSAR